MGPREGILGRGNGLGKPDELSTAGSWFSRPEDHKDSSWRREGDMRVLVGPNVDLCTLQETFSLGR